MIKRCKDLPKHYEEDANSIIESEYYKEFNDPVIVERELFNELTSEEAKHERIILEKTIKKSEALEALDKLFTYLNRPKKINGIIN